MGDKRRGRWCIIFAAFVVALSGCGDPESTSSDPPVSPRLESNERCDYPSVRPTYLPWQRSGEIPEPDRTYDEELDRAALVWTDPESPEDAVALTVYPVDWAASPEEPLGVLIEGSEGYLHNGPPSEHSAWWDLDQPCNLLELIVSLDGMSPGSVDEQVVKVARSLQE